MKDVLVIVGSPRRRGVSARYADDLVKGLNDSDVRVEEWRLATSSVGGCTGCEGCRRFVARATQRDEAVWRVARNTVGVTSKATKSAAESAATSSSEVSPTEEAAFATATEPVPRVSCVIKDDMQRLYTLLDAADEVHVVSPVYFSGPPGQFKSVLDRLQPYWELRCGPAAGPRDPHETKRPVTLHAIGAGGDPFGFTPLETIVRSAFGAAGFSLVKTVDCIGWGQPAAEQHKVIFPQTPARREYDGRS